MPQIQGRLMHRGQKRASDSGQTYAQGAENVPQIQGRLMHRGQKRAPDSGLIYARCA